MGAPFHGIDGLIYISGVELAGGNSWSIDIENDSEEAMEFGDRWKDLLVGGRGFSGSIGAWMHLDSKLIHDCAVSGEFQSFLIYPDRDDLTSYYSGNAIFGAAASGGTGGAVARDGDFVGTGALAIAGFT
jgi:hypothetical protein